MAQERCEGLPGDGFGAPGALFRTRAAHDEAPSTAWGQAVDGAGESQEAVRALVIRRRARPAGQPFLMRLVSSVTWL